MPDLDEISKNFKSGFYDTDDVKEVSNKGENYAEENTGESYTGDSMEAAAEYKRKYDEEQKKKAEAR